GNRRACADVVLVRAGTSGTAAARGRLPITGGTRVRQSSNPVFKDLDKEYGRYATFGGGAAGTATQAGYSQPRPGQSQHPGTRGGYPGGAGQSPPQQPAPAAPSGRTMTIDDIVTKTATTLGVLSVMAVISYVLVQMNESLAMPLTWGGMLVGLGLAMFGIF